MNAKEWADAIVDGRYFDIEDADLLAVADAIDVLKEKYDRAIATLRLAVCREGNDTSTTAYIDRVLAVLKEADE